MTTVNIRHYDSSEQDIYNESHNWSAEKVSKFCNETGCNRSELYELNKTTLSFLIYSSHDPDTNYLITISATQVDLEVFIKTLGYEEYMNWTPIKEFIIKPKVQIENINSKKKYWITNSNHFECTICSETGEILTVSHQEVYKTFIRCS